MIHRRFNVDVSNQGAAERVGGHHEACWSNQRFLTAEGADLQLAVAFGGVDGFDANAGQYINATGVCLGSERTVHFAGIQQAFESGEDGRAAGVAE